MDITNSEQAEKLIASMEHDPVQFIEVFLERQLSDKQRHFIASTKNKNHLVAVWSRQTGKSTVIASYILWRILYGKGITINNEHMPEHIAIVAPIKDQIKNLYEKIEILVNKSEFIAGFITKMNTEIIRAKNGNEAKFLSASPGSQIRGYTATCIVIDESQDITDSKYSADILPFGATTNALVIEAGTPKTKNHFYQAVQSKNIYTIKQPWFECPFLSEEYVMSQKNISPLPLWRQEYLCEFVEEGVLAFPSNLFEPEAKEGQLTGRWNLKEYDYIKEIQELTKDKVDQINKMVKEGAEFVTGLDLGKQNDNTVYTILRVDTRPIQLYVQLKFELDTRYTEIAKKIAVFHRIFQPSEFNIDYSNEKMFIEALIDNDIPVVQDKKNKRGAIAFTNKNKVEMVTTARILLENFQLQLPKSAETLIHEFLNQQFEITENGMYKYFHPSNEHDDSLWSTLLALKQITVLTTDDVVTFQNPWERHDEIVKGIKKEDIQEVFIANRERRDRGRYDRNRYQPAETRRRGAFRL